MVKHVDPQFMSHGAISASESEQQEAAAQAKQARQDAEQFLLIHKARMENESIEAAKAKKHGRTFTPYVM